MILIIVVRLSTSQKTTHLVSFSSAEYSCLCSLASWIIGSSKSLISFQFCFAKAFTPLDFSQGRAGWLKPRGALAKTRKRKGPIGPVGIKNSWKYEKDLIILNVIIEFFTINQVSNIFKFYITHLSYSFFSHMAV